MTVFEIPIGTPQRKCRSCGAPVFWIITSAGARMPVDPSGESHFATCKHADQWRKKKEPKP